MRGRFLAVVGALVGAACARGTCAEPLRAGPGTDTAAALAAATDTLRRDPWGGGIDWVATSFVRRAGDTVEVGADSRCWRGTDAPYATVLLVRPARVVSLFVQIGG